MREHELAVLASALVGQDSFCHFYSRVFQDGYSSSGYFRVWVTGSDYYACEPAFGQQASAGRCFAVVRAWLESDIDCALPQQVAVGFGYRRHGIDLGMRASETAVPSLAYYPSVGSGDHGSHHRIRSHCAASGSGKLQGAAHHFPVDIICCHSRS